MWDLQDVASLGELPCLTSLYLEGNPISLSEIYRSQVFSYFSPRASALSLDGTPPSFSESLLISMAVKEREPERAVASPIVIQPIHSPRKGRRKHTAVIGDIETETQPTPSFEPIFQIEDSLLGPQMSEDLLLSPPISQGDKVTLGEVSLLLLALQKPRIF